jgi:hypothetical protein
MGELRAVAGDSVESRVKAEVAPHFRDRASQQFHVAPGVVAAHVTGVDPQPRGHLIERVADPAGFAEEEL